MLVQHKVKTGKTKETTKIRIATIERGKMVNKTSLRRHTDEKFKVSHRWRSKRPWNFPWG